MTTPKFDIAAKNTSHASQELLDAMRGNEPSLFPPYKIRPACGHSGSYFTVFAALQTEEDRDEVKCPDCLLLMYQATPPMRWDYLLSKGLVKELEPVSTDNGAQVQTQC